MGQSCVLSSYTPVTYPVAHVRVLWEGHHCHKRWFLGENLVDLHEGHICKSSPLVRARSARWLWAIIPQGARLALHAKDPLICRCRNCDCEAADMQTFPAEDKNRGTGVAGW